jgi:hypothetical protein
VLCFSRAFRGALDAGAARITEAARVEGVIRTTG